MVLAESIGIGIGIGAEFFFAETETLFFQILLISFLLLGGIQVFISFKINLALQK